MAARFWVLGTGTWDASDTTHWATGSGLTGGASVPGSGDAVTIDALSGAGTITVNTTVVVQSITCGAMGMTLDFSANNNNVTLSAFFSGTGTGTRTLNMGNGTWTLSAGSGTLFDIGVATNMTFNSNSSVIIFSATTITGNRIFAGGSKTFSTFTIAQASTFTTDAPVTINNSNTFGTLNVNAPVWLRFAQTTVTTITNAFNWAGTAFNSAIMIDGGTGNTATISSANNGAISWGVITGMTFSGGGTFTATNSIDMKANAGITITGPSTGVSRLVSGVLAG